jgi:hypothetical protein
MANPRYIKSPTTAAKLKLPATTALDSYRQSPPCTETVSAGTADSGRQTQAQSSGRLGVRKARFFGGNPKRQQRTADIGILRIVYRRFSPAPPA